MNRLLLAPMIALLLAAGASAARADEAVYEIQKIEPKITVGAKGVATITIAAKNGWHVNEEAPITIALTPPAGLSVLKPKLTRHDLTSSSPESARFDIALEASDAGKKVITGDAKFVMCQASACKPVRETVTLAVEVTPAAAGAKKAKAKKTQTQ
jgi:hypothetical protein